MKIFMILPYFPLPGTGTGNAIYGLSKGLLAQEGIDLIVLSEGTKHEESFYKEVPYIKFKKDKFRTPFSVSRELKQYMKKEVSTVDLVIINGIYSPYVYTMAIFLKSLKIPYVQVPHSVYSELATKKSPLKKIIYFKLFEKKVLEGALIVQMLAPTQIEDVKKQANVKNIISIPNGVDLNMNKSIESKKKFNEKNKFIFLGRKSIFTKSLDLLIDAFANIKNENIELYIQGSDIGETHLLEKQIENLNVENIFLKKSFNGDIIEHLSNYDVLIMPSRYEAFSMAVVEAMLAGLPVIASKEVGAAFFVQKAESGAICDVSSRGIEEMIRYMLVHKADWEKMSENGKKYVCENLSWEKIAEKAHRKYQFYLKSNT